MNNNLSNRLKSLAGIEESGKKFLNNKDFSEEKESRLNEEDEKKYLIFEFPQKEVEPDEEDEKLYKLD